MLAKEVTAEVTVELARKREIDLSTATKQGEPSG